MYSIVDDDGFFLVNLSPGCMVCRTIRCAACCERLGSLTVVENVVYYDGFLFCASLFVLHGFYTKDFAGQCESEKCTSHRSCVSQIKRTIVL